MFTYSAIILATLFGFLATITGMGFIGELLMALAWINGGFAIFGLARKIGKMTAESAREHFDLDAAMTQIESLTATLAVKDTTIATLESRLAELDAIADEAVEYEADDEVACDCAMSGGLYINNSCPCDCHACKSGKHGDCPVPGQLHGDDPDCPIVGMGVGPDACRCICPDCHDTGCENCVEGYVQGPTTPFVPAAQSLYAGYTSAHFLRDLVKSTEDEKACIAAHAATDDDDDIDDECPICSNHDHDCGCDFTDDDDDHIPECPVCGDDPDCMCEQNYDDDVMAAQAEVDELMGDDDDDTPGDSVFDDEFPNPPFRPMSPEEYTAWLASCPDLSFLADALPPEATTTVDTLKLTPKAK